MADKQEIPTASSEPLTAEQEKNAVWLIEADPGNPNSAIIVSNEKPKEAKSGK